jgi:hypothetical protein
LGAGLAGAAGAGFLGAGAAVFAAGGAGFFPALNDDFIFFYFVLVCLI